MLKIKDMNLNNVIRQGDTQPRQYQLDTGNLDLNLTNKSATIRLMTADFQGIGYETTATVSSDNKISFSINDVIPAREYRLEVTVDDYVFPSRATDGQFNIDPSSHGQEANIIQIIGKDEIVRDVKTRVENELEPLVTSLEFAQQSELDRQAQEEARETAEGERETAEVQRKADHANRSAEFDGKADKVVLKNLIENGDFKDGTEGWVSISGSNITSSDEVLRLVGTGSSDYVYAHQNLGFKAKKGDKFYFRSQGTVSAVDCLQIRIILRDGLSGQEHIAYINNPSENKIYILSGIADVQNDFTQNAFIRLNHAYANAEMANGKTAEFDDVIAINLTDIFGAGNEPTKEEMDELIEVIGYIDGEYALNNKEMLGHLIKIISQKANRKQEEWITPTLLNGWVEQTSGQTPQYMKDEFGFVHFKGCIKDGTSPLFMNLPLEYRPLDSRRFPVTSGDSAIKNVTVNGSSVEIRGTSGTYAYLDNVTFEAEV